MGNKGEALLAWMFDQAQRSYARGDVIRAEKKGERLGLMAYRLDSKHRNRAIANLRLAFPERDHEWAVYTARESFRHFGRLVGDFMRSPARTNEEALASITLSDESRSNIESTDGRGVVICSAHFGNWERAAHFVSATGRKLSVVARDLDQEGVQEHVLRLRKSSGIEVMSRGDAAMGMMRRLRRKECVAVLPDQNAGDAWIKFFGHTAGTVLGPAVMAKRTGAMLVPAYCVRIGPGRYEMVVQKPMDPEIRAFEPTEIMAELNLGLEEVVRKAPEQYLWMHDRWKSARRAGLLES